MKNLQLIVISVLVLLLATPNMVLAGKYEVQPGVEISFTDPASSWQVSTEPPSFLVDERAAHLHPPQLEAARKVGLMTPEAAARRMLQDNELFLFNAQTRSHIEVDFSPLKQGEKPASKRALRASARYASEELYGEEGLKDTKANSKKTKIDGAKAAYRVDATYLKHGQPTRFIGVITFAHNNWIYLYYTGPQDAVEDHVTVNQWFKGLKITKLKK